MDLSASMVRYMNYAVVVALNTHFLLFLLLISVNFLCYIAETIAKFGSGLFLLVQVVLLLDFVHGWNESWVAKDEQFWYVRRIGAAFFFFIVDIYHFANYTFLGGEIIQVCGIVDNFCYLLHWHFCLFWASVSLVHAIRTRLWTKHLFPRLYSDSCICFCNCGPSSQGMHSCRSLFHI